MPILLNLIPIHLQDILMVSIGIAEAGITFKTCIIAGVTLGRLGCGLAGI